MPLHYQYGIGSTGFGAWRELATHLMTTDWVISGKYPNFPILYHWRILPNESEDIRSIYWRDIEAHCQYWEGSNPIRKRVQALQNARNHIALFLEYVPQNLHIWLQSEILQGTDKAEAAVAFVDKYLTTTNQYMKTHGLLHFDAHFENILTDGKRLYFTDFGLSLSSTFDLSEKEIGFFKQHQSYDEACAAVNLLHTIITSVFEKDEWQAQLQKALKGELIHASSVVQTVIQQYPPIAFIMDKFFKALQKESKLIPYPCNGIRKIINNPFIEERIPFHYAEGMITSGD